MVKPRRNPDDNILDQPQPVRELLYAMNVLHDRGQKDVGNYRPLDIVYPQEQFGPASCGRNNAGRN